MIKGTGTMPQKALCGLYSIDDVCELLDCKRAYASKVVKDLNRELTEKGYRQFKAGTISRKYFHERYFCDFDLEAQQQQKGGEEDGEKRAV